MSKIFNIDDLVDRYAKYGHTKVQAKKDIVDFKCVLEDILFEEGCIKLHGFGKFEVVERAGRMGRNPKTGDSVQVKPRKTVKFTPSRLLKEGLN